MQKDVVLSQINQQLQLQPIEELAQKQLQQQKKQYSYLKITLAVILVLLSTYSAQIQIEYYGPFVRTIQCFFNYHLLQHDSQDIYEGSDVIYYRTKQYLTHTQMTGFFQKYHDTIQTFYNNSFFYLNIDNSDQEKQNLHTQKSFKRQLKNQKTQIVQIMVVYEAKKEQKAYQQLLLVQMTHQKLKIHLFPQTDSSIIIVYCPVQLLQKLFKSTLYEKSYFQHLQRIQLKVNSIIDFRGEKAMVETKVINVFNSAMMMDAKVQSNVLSMKSQDFVANTQSYNQQGQDQSNQSYKQGQFNQPYQTSQFNQHNLGVRKRPKHHFLNTIFQPIKMVIFVVAALLFAIELMVIIRVNAKIQQTLNQTVQESVSKFSSVHGYSFFDDLNPYKPVKNISYRQRYDIIGRYHIIQLALSFLVLLTIQNKGIVCLFCWTKISIILSSSGNKMMFGFLFKHALPAIVRVTINLLIPLTGFVFFSMLVYRSTRKFESLQLGYYQYLFNYFQYGIYQNFIPIQKYGVLCTVIYFLQLVFIVSMGNNILQSILAQQVLKNSNLKDLTDLIQNIQVQCPVCGCPPQVKKQIKIKVGREDNRQNRFISKYFKKSEQRDNLRSKYQIKITSPQFSPMFHKSQLNKKGLQLRKRGFIAKQRKFSQDFQSVNPKSPLSPGMNPLSPKGLNKKVLIQIGSQLKLNDAHTKKQQQMVKKIISKTETLNKILIDFTNIVVSNSFSQSKAFSEQILRKKLEQIKNLSASIK